MVACALLPVLSVWQLNGFYLEALGRTSTPLFWLADAMQWVALPAVLLWLVSSKASLQPGHYGLDLPAMDFWPLALRTLMVFVTAGLAFVVARNLSWRVLGASAASFQLGHHFPSGLSGTVVWIYAAVSAGLMESIFFIGLPWLWYASAYQNPSEPYFTVAISAFFALAHWEQGMHIAMAAFFAHLVLCKWFFHWKTLWPVVLGHILIDLAVLA